MIIPLILGKRTFPTHLIQGPLAGVSCSPFRYLTWRYSQPAFSCTEMISCKTILYGPKPAYERLMHKDPQEGPVCFQLSSHDPIELAEATKIVTDYGADLIDLNCGCPVKKMRDKGVGSRLLTNPKTLYQLICAMKQNTHLPVSIKIRVEGNSQEKCNQEIAKVVSEAGADFLIVHGRHWTEHYETPCRYDQIRFFVDALNIPVIGNGDIACLDSLKTMLATGCAGVMIGRASVGQPWLIKKLMMEMKQEVFSLPTKQEVGEIFLEHVKRLMELLGCEKMAVLQSRKLAKYYAQGLLPHWRDFYAEMNDCDNLRDMSTICLHYF